MIRQKRAVPFTVKEVTKKGEFSGYASVFDTLDYYRDVIRKGAFVQTIAEWVNEGMWPPCLWSHNAAEPIGPHTLMREDERGLYVEGLLLIDDIPRARSTHALLVNKAIRGMSIGFDYGEDGMEYDGKTNVWNITKVDLWENSLCTFPANEDAVVEQVKSLVALGKLPAPSEFEDLLRDVAGFSRKQAKQIASHGYRSLLRDAGEPERDAQDETKAVDLHLLTILSDYLENPT